MSEKSKSRQYALSRTDTLIGMGVRVEGCITFTGVLRIQGDFVGDVVCDLDPKGRLNVDPSGTVVGTVKAPHIVVGGRIDGPAHSTQSIEIQQGARFLGDAIYQTIDVHAGGRIEGMLTPRALMDSERLALEYRTQAVEAPAGKRFGGTRRVVGALAVLVAVAAGVLLYRDPAAFFPSTVQAARTVDAPLTSDAPAAAPTPSAPASGSAVPDDLTALVAQATPMAPSPSPSPSPGSGSGSGSGSGAPSVGQAPPSGLAQAVSDKVVMVQGLNAERPEGVFVVLSKEPVVLFRKRRDDSGAGTRLDIAKGAALSVAIARSEVVRIAQGRELEVFYQSRKVAPGVIESGTWISFVPQSPSTETQKK